MRTDSFNQLFVLDVPSGRERQLTTSRSDKYDRRWSPDGQWIVFPSNAGGSLPAWKVPVQGGEERILTSGHERMRHLFYSPDGDGFTCSRAIAISIVSPRREGHSSA